MPCACGNDHKYTCPACGAQTCSVDCAKNHKASTGCTGILDPTRYVPRGELLTPTGLDRDYNFLQRMGRDIQLEAPEFKRRARDLVRNNVNVRAMPPQMSRSKQNKSGWNKATQTYQWTVELRQDIRTQGEIRHVPDTTIVRELVGGDLATLIDADGNKVVLDTAKTLADALKGQSVVEFPTIYCGVEGDSSSDSSDSDSDSDSDSSDSDSDSDSSDSAPEQESSKCMPVPVNAPPSLPDPLPCQMPLQYPLKECVQNPEPEQAESIEIPTMGAFINPSVQPQPGQADCDPMEPQEPLEPLEPLEPREPEPLEPKEPREPLEPEPKEPREQPEQPTGPMDPDQPLEPTDPDQALASLLQETQAALAAPEPESLKKVLIEEL